MKTLIMLAAVGLVACSPSKAETTKVPETVAQQKIEAAKSHLKAAQLLLKEVEEDPSYGCYMWSGSDHFIGEDSVEIQCTHDMNFDYEADAAQKRLEKKFFRSHSDHNMITYYTSH